MADVSNIIIRVYNVERFVLKSFPLAGAEMPRRGKIYGVFNMLLKPHTCVSWLSSISAVPQ